MQYVLQLYFAKSCSTASSASAVKTNAEDSSPLKKMVTSL